MPQRIVELCGRNGGNSFMDQELIAELNKRANIVVIHSGDFAEYYGFCVDEVFSLDKEIVDLPPECVKLADEQKTPNPNRPRQNLSQR